MLECSIHIKLGKPALHLFHQTPSSTVSRSIAPYTHYLTRRFVRSHLWCTVHNGLRNVTLRLLFAVQFKGNVLSFGSSWEPASQLPLGSTSESIYFRVKCSGKAPARSLSTSLAIKFNDNTVSGRLSAVWSDCVHLSQPYLRQPLPIVL